MRYAYDICHKQEGKDGKTYWRKIGIALEGDKGLSIKLESVPVGWDGWASLFPPKEKNSQDTRQQPASRGGKPSAQDDDDQIPF